MTYIEAYVGRLMYTKYDSSSLTNEKDHHYFLNSADVCW